MLLTRKVLVFQSCLGVRNICIQRMRYVAMKLKYKHEIFLGSVQTSHLEPESNFGTPVFAPVFNACPVV